MPFFIFYTNKNYCLWRKSKNRSYHLWVYKKKWIVIYNGVDTRKFKPNLNLLNSQYIFRKTNNNLNLKVLDMVARFDKQKGFDILLKSLKNYLKKNKFSMYLVGKNVDNNNLSLKTRINNYNLNNNVFLFGQRNDLNYFIMQ